MSKLGMKLRALREKSGESLQQVADGVRVSRTHIWELEKGKKNVNPTVQLVQKIASHFNVTVTYLIEDTDEPFEKRDPAMLVYKSFKSFDKKKQKTILDMIDYMKNQK